MCGIAGILSTQQDLSSQPARGTLSAMQKSLMHRGPDGQGDFFSASGNAALCHTRLSIIDLSEAGHQPMLSANQRYTITFNGEIYNYKSLRAELEQQGEHFTSHSDTEVLLKLYQREGQRCVDKLRGMFAFVIWDEQEQQAFAARDPLGVKPLYYAHQKCGRFAFASELRSLMLAGLPQNNICLDGINGYFLSGSVAEPKTVISGANLLPAGTSLVWQSGKVTTERFWQLDFSQDSINHTQAVTLTRKALESTVKAHFVSDVPVGIFLSGGIDSCALVALARAVTKAQINTYSIAFETPQWNEGEVAKRVARHFGTQHTEFLITPSLAKPLFNEFLAAVDQPSIDGFNTFCVSKLASEAGEKVVLSGVGGDELFAGYKSFELLPKMHTWSQRLAPLAGVFNLINIKLGKWLPTKVQRTLDFLSQPGSLSAAHQSLRGVFSRHESEQLCASLFNAKPKNSHHCLHADTLLDQVSEQEITGYMRNQLLRDSDVMSMACGLELRVPFVDKQLIEAITAIPAKYRLDYGKTLLVKAVPELPTWVVNRPKQGFRFPFDEWFESQWSDMPLAADVPDNITLRPWYRRWSLLILNDWQRRHQVLSHAPNQGSSDKQAP